MRASTAAFAVLSIVLSGQASEGDSDPFGWRGELLPTSRPTHFFLDFLKPGFDSVSVDPKLPEPQLSEFLRAADIIARAKPSPPAERIGHFAWIGPYPFRGWAARVSKVETTPDGLFVTIRINVNLPHILTSDEVTERYRITDGEVRWIDGNFDPCPRDMLGY